jgi:hypothetical protein|nr:MAG TPA: hypothetical protein [Caudoviricetes sp.]
MKYIVFDIDGVLADCSHRLKYIQGEDKDYDKFYSDEEVMKDKPIEAGKKIIDMLYNLYAMEDFYRPTEFYGKIILLTGRNEVCEAATRIWVSRNILDNSSLYSIIMRPKNDYRPAHEVKKSLIEKHIGFENILFVFDDDAMVNEMYKRHGVICYRPNMTNVV